MKLSEVVKESETKQNDHENGGNGCVIWGSVGDMESPRRQ